MGAVHHPTSVTNGASDAGGAMGGDVARSIEGGAREKSGRGATRDLLDFKELLSPIEQKLISFVRRSFEPGPLDRAVRLGQRYIGSNWIEHCTRNIRHVHGRDRLPPFDAKKSYLVVSNHRSFFDLYVITGYLVNRDMPHRLAFPVRSKFFYDKPLGLFVNGVMSFFAMYPPVFRERSRAALNLASLDETVRLRRRGGAFAGPNSEGSRNHADDPYTLSPTPGGVCSVVQAAKDDGILVFINGLGNDLPRQMAGNFARKGTPIIVNFGAPVDFGTM